MGVAMRVGVLCSLMAVTRAFGVVARTGGVSAMRRPRPLATGTRALVASSSPRRSPRKSSPAPGAPAPEAAPSNSARAERPAPPSLLGSHLRHIMVADDFLEPVLADAMRKTFDDRFREPRTTLSERFVWDYWHVPDQYTLVRTPADQFFGETDYAAFCDALTEFGQRELGCNAITQPWLSYYVDGCEQRMHTDSWHGPFAYVFSLTNWDGRKFTGGETFIMEGKALDYWRRFDATAGLEEGTLTQTVPALFNRLTIFDPRLPHGVKPVRGTQDPREARLVIHGWFTDQGTPFYTGSLAEEEATGVLNAALPAVYEELGKECARVTGVLNVRMHISGGSGSVTAMEAVADTLVPDPDELYDGVTGEDLRQEIMGVLHRHLSGLAFPASADGGDSMITLPFIFE